METVGELLDQIGALIADGKINRNSVVRSGWDQNAWPINALTVEPIGDANDVQIGLVIDSDQG